MLLNNIYVKYISLCIIFSCIVTIIIGLLPLSPTETECRCDQKDVLNNDKIDNNRKNDITSKDSKQKPMLAILVPFRDRFDELLKFAPHMEEFLNKQNIPHHIFVLNQVDRFRFNRAQLINVGFLYTLHDYEYDYIAMHDVDLLPLNDDLNYDYPKNGPFHVAAPNLHPKYHYPTFIGGILLITKQHFIDVNGMSNIYWGWGLEDDEFYVRLKDANLTVNRPANINTGIADTFLHIHDRTHRKRDTTKCFNQREITRRRDRKTGLNTVAYKIVSKQALQIDSIKLTVINIKLECDKQTTPWCDCDGTSETKS